MIRMTLILSAAVFLTLSIAGRDDGQMRSGLMQAEARTVETYRYIPIPQAPVPQLAEVAVAPTAVVTAAALNMRSGPSISSASIDRLGHGEEVTVVSTQGEWTHIRLEGNGGEGWVSSDYLAPMPVLMAGN